MLQNHALLGIKNAYESPVLMLFPIISAHISVRKKITFFTRMAVFFALMANLVAESAGNKGQLSYLIETICRVFITLKPRSHYVETLKTTRSNPKVQSSWINLREKEEGIRCLNGWLNYLFLPLLRQILALFWGFVANATASRIHLERKAEKSIVSRDNRLTFASENKSNNI